MDIAIEDLTESALLASMLLHRRGGLERRASAVGRRAAIRRASTAFVEVGGKHAPGIPPIAVVVALDLCGVWSAECPLNRPEFNAGTGGSWACRITQWHCGAAPSLTSCSPAQSATPSDVRISSFCSPSSHDVDVGQPVRKSLVLPLSA